MADTPGAQRRQLAESMSVRSSSLSCQRSCIQSVPSLDSQRAEPICLTALTIDKENRGVLGPSPSELGGRSAEGVGKGRPPELQVASQLRPVACLSVYLLLRIDVQSYSNSRFNY